MRTLLVALCLLLPLPAVADPFYPAPAGHAALLARAPQLSYDGWTTWPVDMALLRRVNRAVNTAMSYRPEQRDVWGSGADCEDYALRKLAALVEAGVPRGALRLAIARVGGRGHAVLLVRGLWVLDNRRAEPYRLDRSDLRLAARETTGGRWNPATAFARLDQHLRWAEQR